MSTLIGVAAGVAFAVIVIGGGALLFFHNRAVSTHRSKRDSYGQAERVQSVTRRRPRRGELLRPLTILPEEPGWEEFGPDGELVYTRKMNLDSATFPLPLGPPTSIGNGSVSHNRSHYATSEASTPTTLQAHYDQRYAGQLQPPAARSHAQVLLDRMYPQEPARQRSPQDEPPLASSTLQPPSYSHSHLHGRALSDAVSDTKSSIPTEDAYNIGAAGWTNRSINTSSAPADLYPPEQSYWPNDSKTALTLDTDTARQENIPWQGHTYAAPTRPNPGSSNSPTPRLMVQNTAHEH